MDWLSYHRAVIVYYEKIVRIPLPNGEILEIHGEKPEKDSKSFSCIKADEVRLDDIRTVCDFPEASATTFALPGCLDAPPSPNHVFNFPEAEFEEDPQEEPKEEVEEDPEEGPEEDPEAEAEDDVPPPATLPNEALEMPPVGSTYEVSGPSSVTPFPSFYLHGSEIARLDGNTELLLSKVQYLERCEKKRKIDNETCSYEIREGKKRMDKIEQGLGDEMQFSNRVEHRVTDLENREQEKDEEMVKVKKRLGTLKANYSLKLSDRDEWRRAFLNLQALVFERLGLGAWDARPDVGNDGPVSFGEPKPPIPPGTPSSSH
nr:putative reverse transcriptase domain-containing protein [Tanacetum cinerariifolium]